MRDETHLEDKSSTKAKTMDRFKKSRNALTILEGGDVRSFTWWHQKLPACAGLAEHGYSIVWRQAVVEGHPMGIPYHITWLIALFVSRDNGTASAGADGRVRSVRGSLLKT